MDDPYLEFFNLVVDPDIFIFRHVNLVKAFYDEYTSILRRKLEPVYREDLRRKYSLKSIIKYISPSRLSHGIIFLFKKGKTSSKSTIWYGLSDRYVEENGKYEDVYNYDVMLTLPFENVIRLQDSRDKVPKIYPADLYFEDFAIPLGLIQIFLYGFWFKSLKRFTENVYQIFRNKDFTKRQIFRITLKFWGKYYLYKLILRKLQVNQAISLCHYSKHSFNLACHQLGIPNVELMHGHIMRTHPYYNIPNLPVEFENPIRQLIPDFLGVYGEYWRNNLLAGKQFAANQIKVVGYYLHTGKASINEKLQTPKRILITTQPHVQKEILEYVKYLQNQLDPKLFHVIIKPHPAEDYAKYLALQDGRLVSISTTDVYHLLPVSDIHISVFSTVLFEAVRYGLCNYVLFVDRFARECMDVVNSGVAKALYPDQIPVMYDKTHINPKYYFDDFHPDRILNLIQFNNGFPSDPISG